MGNFEDLTGKKFNRLTVIERAGSNKNKQALWLCKCDCGNEVKVISADLKSGHTKSCGCLHIQRIIQYNKQTKSTHNMTNTRLYKIWYTMKQRCYYTKHKSYNNYGAKGIRICQEWINDFQSFYDWAIKNGYDENAKYGKCTLDRIDVNGNYEPDNCRWVDMKVQTRNRTNNHLLTYNGETHCISEWAEKLNIPKYAIMNRLRQKWNLQKIFNTPIRKRKGVKNAI